MDSMGRKPRYLFRDGPGCIGPGSWGKVNLCKPGCLGEVLTGAFGSWELVPNPSEKIGAVVKLG